MGGRGKGEGSSEWRRGVEGVGGGGGAQLLGWVLGDG